MNPRFATLAALVLAAAALRLLPHDFNLTPVAAMALFAGARFTSKWTAFVLPLAAMALSDFFLDFRSPDLASALAILPVVYAAFALTVLLGFALREKGGVARIGLAGFAAAVLFFVVTNFGVWAIGGMYPHTVAGLGDCYVAGIPFFRGALLGTLLYSALLFGGFALAERRFASLREPVVVAA